MGNKYFLNDLFYTHFHTPVKHPRTIKDAKKLYRSSANIIFSPLFATYCKNTLASC